MEQSHDEGTGMGSRAVAGAGASKRRIERERDDDALRRRLGVSVAEHVPLTHPVTSQPWLVPARLTDSHHDHTLVRFPATSYRAP